MKHMHILLLLLCVSITLTKAVSKAKTQKTENTVMYAMVNKIISDSKFQAMNYLMQQQVLKDFFQIVGEQLRRYDGPN